MSQFEYFSDRTNGLTPRTENVLPQPTARAVFTAVTSRAKNHWFAKQFPDWCPDGRGIIGTNHEDLWDTASGFVPKFTGQIWHRWDQLGLPDEVLFDLVEFAAQRVHEPKEDGWHSFYSHYELSFDRKAGIDAFRSEVNMLLHRGGTTFELNEDLEVVRVGSTSVQQVLQELLPNSGDATLDELLNLASAKYRSRKGEDRALALEKLWDAFDRIKTIDAIGRDKKQGISALLSNIESSHFRSFVNDEMNSLTRFGNEFQIRHHEKWIYPVPSQAQDYLFTRMGSLLVLLLRETGRLDEV